MSGEKFVGASLCCGAGRYEEPIWLNKKTGRAQIGRVILCCSCNKQIGDAIPIRNAKPKMNAHDWKLMMQTAKQPPFYFDLKADGSLVPQGFDLLAYEKQHVLDAGRKPSIAPQDRAANDTPEPEPEETISEEPF